MATDAPAELIEVHVGRYKNLSDVRIEWSPRQVLYGANGAGKTNLLEAIALLFGSSATLWQIARRAAATEPGAISALVRSSPAELPVAPGYCLPVADLGQYGEALQRATADSAAFWQLIDAEGSPATTWDDAIRWCLSDERLADLLVAAGSKPLVRYSLQSITGLDEARSTDRGVWMRDGYEGDPTAVRFTRAFSRTLVLDGPVPEWLVELQGDLPDAFAPLRRWLSQPLETRSPYADLLELPPASWVPVHATWLAAERTASEAWFDYDDAFERAQRWAGALMEQLDRLQFLPARDEARRQDDAVFWLVATAATHVNETLASIFDDLEAEATDAHRAELSLLRVHRNGGRSDVGRVDDPHLLGRLSSGQRTWVDIALAHAAAHLEALASRTYWLQFGLGAIQEDDLFLAALELDEHVEALRQGVWHPYELDIALNHFERLLIDANNALVLRYGPGEVEQVLAATVLPQLTPELRTALRPPLTVHLYDEPERHLHPSTQRRVHDRLGQPGAADVLVATHSHLFLGGPGWRHLHLETTPEGPVAVTFEPNDLDLTSRISTQMGLTRGELLNQVGYVLFVEGPVDEIVLTELYGPLLREAGVLILPIHGIDETASLAELELIGRVLDVGAGILADHARTNRLAPDARHRDLTKEEAALIDLRKRLKRRGVHLDLFGLQQEDIVAYLHEDAIAAEEPAFPGWKTVLESRGRHEKFKSVVQRHLGETHLGRRFVERVAQRMQSESLPARGDLPGRITEIVRAATDTRFG